MKRIAALIATAAIALPQVAIAQSATAVFRDNLGNLVIGNSGIAPGTLITIDYPIAPREKNITASGPCSLLIIKKSSTVFIGNYAKIGSTTLDVSVDNPAPGKSFCVNGVINPAYPWATSGGYKYISSSSGLVIFGATGTVLVSSNPGKERLGKVDSCGRIVIKNNEKWKIEHLNDGDGTFAYRTPDSYWSTAPLPASATSNSAPYICYKKALYKPL